MITHHPSQDLCLAFVQGELPASLSIAMAMHAELCPQCQQQLVELTEQVGEQALVVESTVGHAVALKNTFNDEQLFAAMINDITVSDKIPQQATIVESPLVIEVKGNSYQLPRALQSVAMSGWLNLGKLSRARLNLNEGHWHSSLLHIDKNGKVPEHTHGGFELTLLLTGQFKDELGSYEAGDFIYLSQQHSHTPYTENGCLCYTVVDAALHFKQGMSKWLNPIGKLIY